MSVVLGSLLASAFVFAVATEYRVWAREKLKQTELTCAECQCVVIGGTELWWSGRPVHRDCYWTARVTDATTD